MKLVDQEVDVWGECPSDLFEAMRWIERAGRTCYNSPMSDPPDPYSYIKKLLKFDPPHSSVIEHSNMVMVPGPGLFYDEVSTLFRGYNSRWLTKTLLNNVPTIYGNIRAFMEATGSTSIADLMERMKEDKLIWMSPIVSPREVKRVTVKLVTDRNVMAEITRHRNDVAFSVRSQRYVDESKDMEFIKPSWYHDAGFIPQETFLLSCEQSELNYKTLRKSLTPQHARTVLNGHCRTVIVMSAYLPQWDWMFKLRRGSGAYPQMIALMDMVYDQFKERGYVKNN